MVYSDTTNKNGLMQRMEFWTNLGDANITGNATLKAQMTQGLNNWYHKVVTMILEAQDEWDFDDINHTDFPILTTNLVADQQDYSLPASERVLKIKRAEITYDGTNWYKAEPLDVNELSISTDTTSIANNFDTTTPFYDIQYNSIFLYPIPTSNVTAGLKVWWTREIDEFTTSDTTQEPGIDEPFHEMLALGPSYDWILVNKPDNSLLISRIEGLLADYERRLVSYYGRKQQDRNMRLSGAYVDYE